MDFIKGILGFYFWSLVIVGFIFYHVGLNAGVKSEPESYGRFIAKVFDSNISKEFKDKMNYGELRIINPKVD